MPDVGSQLAEYFDAATERIDAEDVLVRATVVEQLTRRTPPRRLRPTWAAAAGFAGVLALVGGMLLAGWLLHDPSGVQPQPVGTPAAETGGGWGWWPLVIAGAAAVIGIVVLVSRRLHRATKEVEMQTLDEKQREATEARTQRRSRRPWLIGLAILVVVAGGIAAWAIIEANQKSDIEIATEFADAWDVVWRTGDGEAAAALFTEEGVWKEAASTYEGRDAIRRRVSTASFFSNGHGEVTEVEDGVFSVILRATPTEGGRTFDGEMLVTLEGDLVSFAELVRWTPAD